MGLFAIFSVEQLDPRVRLPDFVEQTDPLGSVCSIFGSDYCIGFNCSIALEFSPLSHQLFNILFLCDISKFSCDNYSIL